MAVRRAVRVAGAGVVGGAAAAYAGDERVRVAVGGEGASGLARFSRTALNAFVTGLDYKWTLRGLEKGDPEYKERLAEANLRAAHRLYAVCHAHGGLYTKFGQGVANMTHALPPEFTKVLEPLQDKANEMPPEMAMQTLREELGRAPEEVFAEFDTAPVAAASLAQVHRAVLRETGEKVAVKLQYPYLKSQTRADLATMELITGVVGYWFPDFSYSWLTPEFQGNMALELDFTQEARNGERLARMFAHRSDVHVPSINWELTTPRMLVMEFVDMLKVTDLAALEAKRIDPLEVAATVSSVFGDMIHVHGFVHCDPHPGNLGIVPVERSLFASTASAVASLGYAGLVPLAVAGAVFGAPGSAVAVTSAASAVALTAVAGLSALFGSTHARRSYAVRGQPYKLVVLDHGMYRRLEPEFRSTYCRLWRALLLRDPVEGRAAAVGLGVPGEQFDVLSMMFTFRSASSAGQTGARMSKEERREVRERYKDVTPGDVNTFLQRLPRDLLFVMRSTNIVRAINLNLGGTSRLRFKIMGESAVRGLLVPNPTQDELDRVWAQRAEEGLAADGPYRINLPVASEVFSTETLSWRQDFEMRRLGLYLTLIDRSWGLLAAFVKLL